MTARWTLAPGDVKALDALADAIVPGDARWPAASRAIEDIGAILTELGETDVHAILALARRLPPLLRDHAEATVSAEQIADPARFERLIRAIYRVYYSSASVMAAVEEIANAAPREPSPSFDKSLVAQVIATQAGKRRL